MNSIFRFMERRSGKLVSWMALAFLLAGGPLTALGADNSAPVHKLDGSFVREWLVLGPFRPEIWRPTFWRRWRRSERSAKGRDAVIRTMELGSSGLGGVGA